MNKVRFFAVLSVFFIFPLAQLSAQNKQLVIYTWEEMFPPSILESFERSTGLKVVYKNFEYNEDMLMELEIAEGGEYDLVVADDYILEFILEEKLAQKLDKSKLSNLRNVNPVYQRQFYDPKDEYTVPYGAGVQTIVYDPSRINITISGYSDLWNSTLKNSIGVTGNYRVINGMALKVLGKSYNTEDVAEIKTAGNRLKALAPNIRVIKDTGLEEELVSGRIAAAVMYTDQVMKSKLEKPGLKVVYPKEGIGFGIMAAFIPSRAPNADAAYKFLNYILDAKRGAECFEYLGYYCTYLASEPHIKNELKEFLVPRQFRNSEMIFNLSQEAEDEHARIWKEFKAAVK